jgi:hypothetical protein
VVGVISRAYVVNQLAHDHEGDSTFYAEIDSGDVLATFDEMVARAGKSVHRALVGIGSWQRACLDG